VSIYWTVDALLEDGEQVTLVAFPELIDAFLWAERVAIDPGIYFVARKRGVSDDS